MSKDTIYRQDAIDALYGITAYKNNIPLFSAVFNIEKLPSAQPETCEGCKHLGKWENEVEYGYPSPCTRCKRRAGDNYDR